jgi:hypothetical protein
MSKQAKAQLKDCESGKIRNPKTNRCVKENGAIGKKLKKDEVQIKTEVKKEKKIKDCESGKIRNSQTNRCVKENEDIDKILDIQLLKQQKIAASKIVLAIKAKKARGEVIKQKQAKTKDYFKLYNRKNGDTINKYSNLYEVLDLPLNSSSEEVKKKYRKLALVFHPDKYANIKRNESDSERNKAENEMKFINEAYKILGNNNYKKEYDKLLEEDKDYVKNNSLTDIIKSLLKEKPNEELLFRLLKAFEKYNRKIYKIPFNTGIKISTKLNLIFNKRKDIQSKQQSYNELSKLNKLMDEAEELLRPY